MKSILMRLAKAVLQNVLQQLNQLLQSVEDQALNVLKAIVQQVLGGVWTGKGADAFVEEVSSLGIPHVGRVMDSITSMSNNLNKAREIMENADNQARSAVGNLVGSMKFY